MSMSEEKNKKVIQKSLIDWFQVNKRDLPWRKDVSPYRTWISEIMLQQTQVDTVIPYFNRWMDIYPDIQSVAKAKEKDLIKIWEGLGYYSRVRNIHKASRIIVNEYKAVFPKEYDQIISLPGIGPYTVGAILSLAFKRPFPIVDGNVIRVYSRFLADDSDISQTKNKNHFWKIAEQYLSMDDPDLYNEGLMELGATVCTPASPKCEQCPWKNQCKAFRSGIQLSFPVKMKKIKYEKVRRVVGMIQDSEDRILIQKIPEGQVMGGLWEFPGVIHYFDHDKEKNIIDFMVSKKIDHAEIGKYLGIVKHSYTKYRIELSAYFFKIKMNTKGVRLDFEHQWVEKTHLKDYAFNSGARKLLKYII